jgi:hypothetical protein
MMLSATKIPNKSHNILQLSCYKLEIYVLAVLNIFVHQSFHYTYFKMNDCLSLKHKKENTELLTSHIHQRSKYAMIPVN